MKGGLFPTTKTKLGRRNWWRGVGLIKLNPRFINITFGWRNWICHILVFSYEIEKKRGSGAAKLLLDNLICT
jgi:hypothetical protein